MLIPIVPIYGATGVSALAAVPISEGVKAVATIPFILMPAFAYQEEVKELLRHRKLRLFEK